MGRTRPKVCVRFATPALLAFLLAPLNLWPIAAGAQAQNPQDWQDAPVVVGGASGGVSVDLSALEVLDAPYGDGEALRFPGSPLGPGEPVTLRPPGTKPLLRPPTRRAGAVPQPTPGVPVARAPAPPKRPAPPPKEATAPPQPVTPPEIPPPPAEMAAPPPAPPPTQAAGMPPVTPAPRPPVDAADLPQETAPPPQAAPETPKEPAPETAKETVKAEPAKLAEPPPAAPVAAEPAAATTAATTAQPDAAPEPPAPPTQAAALPPGDGFDAGETRAIPFTSGKAELPADAEPILKAAAEALGSDPGLRVQLKAYAANDKEGESRARRLSLSRALGVRSFLIKEGVQPTRIDVRALGSEVPEGPADRVDVSLVSR